MASQKIKVTFNTISGGRGGTNLPRAGSAPVKRYVSTEAILAKAKQR